MHEAIARHIDGDPFYKEINAGFCGQEFNCEPNIWNTPGSAHGADNIQAWLRGVGQSNITLVPYLTRQFDILQSLFLQTHVNAWGSGPFQTYDFDGNSTVNSNGQATANGWYQTAIDRGILLGINSTDSESYSSDTNCQAIHALTPAGGRPLLIAEQTATYAKIHNKSSDCYTVASLAAANGVISLELPLGFDADITPSQRDSLNALFQANYDALVA